MRSEWKRLASHCRGCALGSRNMLAVERKQLEEELLWN